MKNFAVLGHPITHSKSPKIFNFLANRFNVSLQYDVLDIPPGDLAKSFQKLKNYDGFNITAPYKKIILEMALGKMPDVEVIGAANVFKKENSETFTAYNTDVYGFEKSLTGFDLKKKTALILGSSGAAKAAVLGLGNLGVENIYFKARNHLAYSGFEIPVREYGMDDIKPEIVVQATTIGLNKSFSEIEGHGDLDFFDIDYSRAQIALDLNYAPLITPFMEIAQKNNVPHVMNGEKMLIMQALKTFEIWYDLELPEKENLSKEIKEIL